MKFPISVWIIVAFALEVPSLFSQSSPGKIQLSDFLLELEDRYEITFNYDPELIKGILIMPVSLPETPSLIVDHLKKYTPFRFIISDDYITISNSLQPDHRKEEDTQVFRGRVFDANSGDPLPHATVMWQATQTGTESDKNGRFTIRSDALRRDSLEFYYLGYEKLSVPRNKLIAGRVLNFSMRPSKMKLDGIIIKESAPLPIDFSDEAHSYQLNATQLQLQAGWAQEDLLRMVQILPGIQAVDESAANLNIRGGTPDQNLILVDGIPVYKSGHFFGHFSTLNNSIVEDVKIYKGGYGALFGGRVGGVIDIRTKVKKIERFKASFGMDPINLQGSLSVPLFKKKSSLLISGRKSVIEKYMTGFFSKVFNQKFQSGKIADYRAIEEKNLLNKNNAFYIYEDFHLQWQYRYKEDDALTLSHFTNRDNFKYDFEIDQPFFTGASTDHTVSDNQGTAITVSNRWLPWWQSRLTLVNSEFTNQYTASFTSDLSAPIQIAVHQRNRMEQDHLALHQKFLLGTNDKLTFGIEANTWEIDFQTIHEKIWQTRPDSFDLTIANTVLSTFIDYEWNYRNRFALQAGLRNNRLNQLQKNKVEPRLQVRYKLDSTITLKSSVGSYLQFISQLIPDLDENNLGTSNGIWITTERNVVPVMNSRDLTLGISLKKRGWHFDFEGYLKKIRGLSALNLRIDRFEDQIRPGESKSRGIEMIAQKKFDRFRSLFSYHLAEVSYKFPDFNGKEYFPAPHDRRHQLQFNQLMNLGNFDMVLSFHFGSGTPYSVPTGFNQYLNDDQSEIYHELTYHRRNSERIPVYHRLDFSLHYRWIRPYLQARMSFSIFNVYDRSNIINRLYYINYLDDDRSKPEILYLDRQGIRIAPSFQFELSF